jgi:DNA-binding transcriptional LysR family regulator
VSDLVQAPVSTSARNVLSLPRLRGFLSLARHLNFRRAASELGITQPGLSSQIKAMEQALGVSLFARTTRSVRLTADGERFVLHARHLLEELESTVERIGEISAVPRGTVAFSCIPTIAATVFPRFIHEFRRRHPGVRVEMTDDTTVSMERRIIGGEVEFGIGGIPMRSNDLDFAAIAEDPFVLVCRADHPLARQRRVPVAAVLDYPIITLAKDSNVRGTLVDHFKHKGFAFEPAYQLVHHYTVGAMVEAGLGVTLLPSMACVLLHKSSELCVRPLEGDEPTRKVGLITRRGEALRSAAHHFYQLAAKMMTNATGRWRGLASIERSRPVINARKQSRRRKTR